MAVQNAYNNYMKRQQQKPINNFKEKVKNSLGGVQTNTNYITPSTTSVSHSKPIQTYTNTNTRQTQQNAITTPPVAQNTTPATTTTQPKTQITTQPTTQVTNTTLPNAIPTDVTTQPIENATPQTDGGVGMMGLSEINEAFTPQARNTRAVPETTSAEVNTLANDPGIQQRAYSAGKTPQQMAQELLEQQKQQLQKDWELKQEQIKQQQQQAQNSFNQSVTDAESAYNESIDKINQDRYDRQQDLNVSGSKRGIQYSPQQLGLETVANINTNKNITEAGKQRNELLNKLQQQLNELNANLLMNSQNSVNDYNNALAQLNADYMNKIMDWEWDDKKIKEEREWQEKQTLADREWQEKMDKANKEWQSSENALDRNASGSGRSYGGGGYSSYSSSYSPYSRYSRSRSGYSSSSMDGYDRSAFSVDPTENDIESRAFEKTMNEAMEDSYYALSGNMSPYSMRTRANDFSSLMGDMFTSDFDRAKEAGLSEDSYYNLIRNRNRAMKQLFEDNATVDAYNGDIIKRGDDKTKLYKKMGGYDGTQAVQAERMMNRFKAEKNKSKQKTEVKSANTTKKTKEVKTSKTNVTKQSENTKKALNNSAKNIKKSTENAKKNIKTSTANAKKNVKTSTSKAKENVKKSVSNSKNNVKKSTTNAKKNTKKSTSNASKNLKKNINKFKDKVKKMFR